MTDVIPVLFGARWRIPVCLVQQKRVRHIFGPAEAIRYMRTCFNDQSSPAYSRAVEVCFAALRCEADPDVARSFFLAAYEGELEAQRRRH
jgi:hypothetical protein